ncbi:RNA polymerase sigma factor [Marinisporobacter balticus]|uniref:RNA polymerase sigma factor (Sigma-70 family) n=1 Tax=Marinisporobacter balticus TaxID=2018667 RepID=A0A4R2K7S6_9FIRM|nr:sigma-70 family RNA polymerase sigma factor [Marinisporobacter balticus]TCO68102.1 RNA polymerase sigma factor (sigma-70 family) [Marinisporobacter balticus]
MELFVLLEKAKNNDKDAAYEIIKDFGATLKKLSKSLHYEEAETDLIIELLKLIQNIDIEKFKDSNHKQITKYIHMHLKKRTLNLLKKHENKFKECLEINHEILADDSIADTESTVLTSILIKSLVKQQRDIITMEFIQGFSEKDISQILGISRQAVNRAKNRALNNLRKFFIETGGESIGRKDHRASRKEWYMDSTNSSPYILYSQNPREKGSSSRRKGA